MNYTPYAPYTIRATWHYGNDYRVSEHAGPRLIDALMKVENAYGETMPEWAVSECLTALRNGEAYRGWSWLTFELIGKP